MAPASEGNGGRSSASGCHTVQVENVVHNTLGSVAFKFRTYTHSCWNRAAGQLSNLTTRFEIEPHALWRWRGEVTSQRNIHFYSWSGGHPTSGHIHTRMGHFDNCPVKLCFNDTYPVNRLRSHSDGTWWWSATS